MFNKEKVFANSKDLAKTREQEKKDQPVKSLAKTMRPTKGLLKKNDPTSY